MKKVFCTFLLVAACIACCITCHAESLQYQMDELQYCAEDYEAISELKEDIRLWIADYMQALGKGEMPESVDLDVGTAKRIYVGANEIFESENLSEESIRSILSSCEYMWLLDVVVNGDTYEVNISKGQPMDEESESLLTEEQKQEVQKNEGKWIVAGVSQYDGKIIDYNAKIEKNLQVVNCDEAEIVFCGGLRYIYNPVAIVLSQNEDIFMIPMHNLEFEGTEKQVQALKADGAESGDEIFRLEGMKEAVIEMDQKMEGTETDMSGSGAKIILYENKRGIVFAVVLLTVVVVLSAGISLLLWKRKTTKQQ